MADRPSLWRALLDTLRDQWRAANDAREIEVELEALIDGAPLVQRIPDGVMLAFPMAGGRVPARVTLPDDRARVMAEQILERLTWTPTGEDE